MIEKLGADHRVTVDERELLIQKLAPELTGNYVYLQTCNRVELYRGDGPAEHDIIRHLFRVVSGLESKLLGENHIQGQVKRAYQTAQEHGHLSKGLHQLFQLALKTGKRVRSETGISNGAVSHSHATYVLLRDTFADLAKKRVLIVGKNHLLEKVIRFLHRGGTKQIYVCNRTLEKCQHLKQEFNVSLLPIHKLASTLSQFDIVVSATSSPEPIITTEMLQDSGETFCIDLAVPRDIEASADELPEVTLYNVEQLEAMVDNSIEQRQSEITRAEAIIEEEILEYEDVLHRSALHSTNEED